MMGTKGMSDGIEADAFDRGGRRALVWRRGELRRIKRQFWKRVRRAVLKDVGGQDYA